jgi:hypothetical protein
MGETKINWRQAMGECLWALLREQAGSECPIVDYEVRESLAGGADDMRVWFVCRNEAEKNQFINTERSRSISLLKKKMLATSFPESALASVEINVVSRADANGRGTSLFQ